MCAVSERGWKRGQMGGDASQRPTAVLSRAQTHHATSQREAKDWAYIVASFRVFKCSFIISVRMQLHARSSFVLISVLTGHALDD